MKPTRVFLEQTCHWSLQASQSAWCSGQSSHVTQDSVRERRSREHSHVQLLRAWCSTEKNNLCCNNGAVKSFYELTVMFCCLCGAESTCRVQAAEHWSVSVFTFLEERLGGWICIGLKWLQCYWQMTREGGGGGGKMLNRETVQLPRFNGNGKQFGKFKNESLKINSSQVSWCPKV